MATEMNVIIKLIPELEASLDVQKICHFLLSQGQFTSSECKTILDTTSPAQQVRKLVNLIQDKRQDDCASVLLMALRQTSAVINHSMLSLHLEDELRAHGKPEPFLLHGSSMQTASSCQVVPEGLGRMLDKAPCLLGNKLANHNSAEMTTHYDGLPVGSMGFINHCATSPVKGSDLAQNKKIQRRKEKMASKLNKEMLKLEKQFKELHQAIGKKINHKRVSLKDVQKRLQSQQCFNNIDDSVLIFDYTTAVGRAQTIPELLAGILEYASWYNYQLVARLATDPECKGGGKHLVHSYETFLKEHAKRLLSECPAFMSSSVEDPTCSCPLPGYISMGVQVKMSYQNATLQDINNFKHELCSLLQLHPDTLSLWSVQPGEDDKCHLIWMVPLAVKQHVMNVAVAQAMLFASRQIFCLKIDSTLLTGHCQAQRQSSGLSTGPSYSLSQGSTFTDDGIGTPTVVATVKQSTTHGVTTGRPPLDSGRGTISPSTPQFSVNEAFLKANSGSFILPLGMEKKGQQLEVTPAQQNHPPPEFPSRFMGTYCTLPRCQNMDRTPQFVLNEGPNIVPHDHTFPHNQGSELMVCDHMFPHNQCSHVASYTQCGSVEQGQGTITVQELSKINEPWSPFSAVTAVANQSCQINDGNKPFKVQVQSADLKTAMNDAKVKINTLGTDQSASSVCDRNRLKLPLKNLNLSDAVVPELANGQQNRTVPSSDWKDPGHKTQFASQLPSPGVSPPISAPPPSSSPAEACAPPPLLPSSSNSLVMPFISLQSISQFLHPSPTTTAQDLHTSKEDLQLSGPYDTLLPLGTSAEVSDIPSRPRCESIFTERGQVPPSTKSTSPSSAVPSSTKNTLPSDPPQPALTSDLFAISDVGKLLETSKCDQEMASPEPGHATMSTLAPFPIMDRSSPFTPKRRTASFLWRVLGRASNEWPANVVIITVHSTAMNDKCSLRVEKGQKLVALYRAGEQVFARTCSGDTGWLPYDICRLSVKYYGQLDGYNLLHINLYLLSADGVDDILCTGVQRDVVPTIWMVVIQKQVTRQKSMLQAIVGTRLKALYCDDQWVYAINQNSQQAGFLPRMACRLTRRSQKVFKDWTPSHKLFQADFVVKFSEPTPAILLQKLSHTTHPFRLGEFVTLKQGYNCSGSDDALILHKGMCAQVHEIKDSWLRVSAGPGLYGWVPAHFCVHGESRTTSIYSGSQSPVSRSRSVSPFSSPIHNIACSVQQKVHHQLLSSTFDLLASATSMKTSKALPMGLKNSSCTSGHLQHSLPTQRLTDKETVLHQPNYSHHHQSPQDLGLSVFSTPLKTQSNAHNLNPASRLLTSAKIKDCLFQSSEGCMLPLSTGNGQSSSLSMKSSTLIPNRTKLSPICNNKRASPVPPRHGLSSMPPRTGFSPMPHRTGLSPVPPRTGFSPMPPRAGLSPVLPRTGLSPMPHRTGLSPVPHRTGLSPVPHRTGLSPVPSRTGFPPVPPRNGLSPVPHRTVLSSSSSRNRLSLASSRKATSPGHPKNGVSPRREVSPILSSKLPAAVPHRNGLSPFQAPARNGLSPFQAPARNGLSPFHHATRMSLDSQISPNHPGSSRISPDSILTSSTIPSRCGLSSVIPHQAQPSFQHNGMSSLDHWMSLASSRRGVSHELLTRRLSPVPWRKGISPYISPAHSGYRGSSDLLQHRRSFGGSRGALIRGVDSHCRAPNVRAESFI